MNTLSAMSVDDGLLITAGGYKDLRTELEALRGDIGPELSERLRDARQDGHIADNPPLFDLLEEHAQLDQRIAFLEARLAAAQIAAPATDGRAGIGSRVRVRDLEVGNLAEYELVGAIEPQVGDGRVSVAAPVGRALVGQRVGARVNVATPGGTVALEVLDVRPADVQQPTKTAAMKRARRRRALVSDTAQKAD